MLNAFHIACLQYTKLQIKYSAIPHVIHLHLCYMHVKSRDFCGLNFEHGVQYLLISSISVSINL